MAKAKKPVPDRNSLSGLAMAKAVRVAIGSAMRKIREERGLSARAVGDIVGIDANTVYRKENGAYPFDAYELTRFAAALGCTLADLLQGVKG